MRFSANLGFLYRELSLPDAIRAAALDGFDAVEMHWPYEVDPLAVANALAETNLPLLGINTARGNVGAGEFGLSALPGREEDALRAIDEAVAWAVATGCRNIHVMAGITDAAEALDTFLGNIRYAIEQAEPYGIGILVEPLNPRDAPGYFLDDFRKTLRVVNEADNKVRIMYDCYHMQIVHGDVTRTISSYLDAIGHIQFAAVPDRSEPDHGELDFGWLLPELANAGYAGFFGAEYHPRSGSLAWMKRFSPESPSMSPGLLPVFRTRG